jgi:hypothetical protein
MKKLTITLDEDVYAGLHATIGRGNISRFLSNMARPHVVQQDIADGYAAMAADATREAEALAWSEAMLHDTNHAAG